MRRRKSTKVTIGHMVIFILALALSIAAVQLLPIPEKFKMMTFFLLIPAISAAGVFIISIAGKKKR